jgi:hypothetical protein
MSEYDLIEIHNSIQKYYNKLSSEKDEINNKIIVLLERLVLPKVPYGIDKQKLEDLRVKYEYMKKEEDKLNKGIKYKEINYKEWNDFYNKLEEHEKEIEQIDIILPYLIATVEPIIKEYTEEIKKPISITFMGNKNIEKNSKKCIELYDLYIEKGIDILGEMLLYKIIKKGPKMNICSISSLCINTTINNVATQFDDNDYSEDYMDDNKVQFDDIGRVNLNTRYKYERKIHFRDTLQQFQGTQNKQISEKVYKDLEEMILKHSLIDEKFTDIRRFHKVTRDHIRLFLSELQYYNHYEDTQLIYSKLTGKAAPNISKYEKELNEDFDELVGAFCNLPDEIRKNRKNFLNNKYVLKQLLRRRNIKVPEADLDCLKTPSRRREHDEIYGLCCKILGWNFTPMS